MKLKSKARTLKSLKLINSKIPSLQIYKCKDYLKNREKILNMVKQKFGNHKIAVRSSFNNEDTSNTSNAGKFKSFINLDTKNKNNLNNKILEVIKSKKNLEKNEEFFIQKMVGDVYLSGVLLTRNLENYSECININYSKGNKTDQVTSGKFGTKTLLFYDNKKFKIPIIFENLYESVKEIKKKLKEKDLDVEFAINKKREVFILQVRKLIVPKKKIKSNLKEINFFLFKNIS